MLSTATSPIAIPPASPILLFSNKFQKELLKESQTIIAFSLSAAPTVFAASSPKSVLSTLLSFSYQVPECLMCD